MHSILHILNTSTELMSAVELMSGAKSRKWVHQKPTNQPTNQVGAPETNEVAPHQQLCRKEFKIICFKVTGDNQCK